MLSPTQLTDISRYLKKSGILYEEVHHELLDHFINAIEAQMANHVVFDDALVDVGRQFGGRRGLTFIQTQRIKASNHQYSRSLKSYLAICVRWANLPLTLAAVWLLYTLIGIAPNMMAVAYSLGAISTIPFLFVAALMGKHILQFFQHKRALAWSLQGFTLLSKSMGTALSFFYPNLFVLLGFMNPKSTSMNSEEQIVFFLLSCVILFLCFAQLKLVSRYATCTEKPLNYLS